MLQCLSPTNIAFVVAFVWWQVGPGVDRVAVLHLQAALKDMHKGERVCIFELPLSSVANLHCYLHRLLEPKPATHSTWHEAFLHWPCAIGLSLGKVGIPLCANSTFHPHLFLWFTRGKIISPHLMSRSNQRHDLDSSWEPIPVFVMNRESDEEKMIGFLVVPMAYEFNLTDSVRSDHQSLSGGRSHKKYL
jgi:hypothetical protein